MSGVPTSAAALGLPNGSLRQPQMQAQASSNLDTHASSKKSKESGRNLPGPVRDTRGTGQLSRSQHKPNTEKEDELVYVLTFRITEPLSGPMDDMRKRYFPTRLNRTPAHLTLFHALPHSQLECLEAGLLQLSSSMGPFLVSAGKPFRMRKGVGVNVDTGYKQMKDVHGRLQVQWLQFLSEQDAGGFRPHWTVMNKVDDEKKIEDAFVAVREEISKGTQRGKATGLDLWIYNRGNWEWAKEYPFREP